MSGQACRQLGDRPHQRCPKRRPLHHTPTAVPEDYEPPFFEEAGHRATGSFERKPFTMWVQGTPSSTCLHAFWAGPAQLPHRSTESALLKPPVG